MTNTDTTKSFLFSKRLPIFITLNGCFNGLIILLFSDQIDFYLSYIFLSWPIQVTGWSISHFLRHFVCSLLYPGYFIFNQLGGIAWEAFELMYGRYTEAEEFWTSGGLFGQFSDLIMNCLGYASGTFIYSKYKQPFFLSFLKKIKKRAVYKIYKAK